MNQGAFKITTLATDIPVQCVAATVFPDGVQQAHQQLHAQLAYSSHRNYFGLSWPGPSGDIVYKAAASELYTGELTPLQLQEMCIVKGDYLYLDIPDFMHCIPEIGAAFQLLIQDERIAPDGFCIEWYLSQTLCRCMVRMKSSND